MLNLGNICRICLSDEFPKLPIFTEGDHGSDSKPTIPEKIMSFAQVKVVKDDGLPMNICVKCYCQVDTTVEFKRRCEESFNYFHKQHGILSNLKDIPPPLLADKENIDSQHHILPEHNIKVEECKPEGELPIQVFREGDCDESLTNNTKMEFEAPLIKCQILLDYPDMELDLSNVKIKNCRDNWSGEEYINSVEVHSENFQNAEAPFDTSSMSLSAGDKLCECRGCKMVSSDGREADFPISFAHGSGSLPCKYFYSSEDENKHMCSSPLMESSREGADGYCHLCNTGVKEIKSHMNRHCKNGAEVGVRSRDMSIERDGCVMETIEISETQFRCGLCSAVCFDEKFLKAHLKCLHSDHRVIYQCFMCKSRKFFNKVNCIKHLMKKHGITVNEDMQYKMVQVKSKRTAKDGQQRKLKKKRYVFRAITEFFKRNKDNDSNKGASEPKKSRANKMAGNPEKCLKQTHPPFSHKAPIVRNNFNLICNQRGVKRYVCRGCEVICIGYVAAIKHYRTYRK